MNIVDKRNPKDFRGITFSGFKKSHVKTKLIECLLSCKIEDSSYWGVELICAGHYSDLWEIIIL